MSHSPLLQLDPTIPVVTPEGSGEAIGWIDYSKDDDLLWVVFLRKNGECWIYPNSQIRACPNITANRMPGMSSSRLAERLAATLGGGMSTDKTSRKEPRANGGKRKLSDRAGRRTKSSAA